MKLYIIRDENRVVSLDTEDKFCSDSYVSEQACKEAVMTEDQFQEIQDKMQSIAKNMARVKEVAQYNADNSIAIDSSGKPLKEQELREVEELDRAYIIELDTAWAYDEFLFRYRNHDLLPNSCNSIEVVTKEVAVSNDEDFLSDYSSEELQEYQVGGTLSNYSKLDKKYYFRFM